MISNLPIPIPRRRLAAYCRRSHIHRLALFGSVLRDDFGPESDIDVLVEFERGRMPGLLQLAGMSNELSEWFGGRYVDMKTPRCLRPETLTKILAEALLLHGTPFRRPRPNPSHGGSGRKGPTARKRKKTA